jgi:hypothetical protein
MNDTDQKILELGRKEFGENCELVKRTEWSSPDGTLAAFGATGTAKKRLALVPVDSPRETKLVDPQRPVQSYRAVRFIHDGKAVVYA